MSPLHLILLLWHSGAINLAGFSMVAVGFGFAALSQTLFGELPEGLLMMIGSPVIIVLDLLYRARRPERSWWYYRKGGSLLFLPAWQLGTFWFILGACYVIWPGLR